MLILIPLCAGVVLLLLKRYVDKKMGEPLPLWEVALTDLREKLTHPHEFAQEMDDLMREVEPTGAVDWDAYAQLKKRLLERSLSTDENLRENEDDAALAYLLVWKLRRNEAENPAALTGVRLVGTHAVEDQSLGDKIRSALLVLLLLAVIAPSARAQQPCAQCEMKVAELSAQLAAEKALSESLRAIRDKLQQDLATVKSVKPDNGAERRVEVERNKTAGLEETLGAAREEIAKLRAEVASLTKQRDKSRSWRASFLRVIGKKAKK